MITEKKPSRGRTGERAANRMKLTTEAHQLDLRRMKQAGFLTAPVGSVWSSEVQLPGATGSSIAVYTLLKRGPSARAWMGVGGPSTSRRDLQVIELEATDVNLGGQRWWFRCPNGPSLEPDDLEELDEDSEASQEPTPRTRLCIGRCLVLYRTTPGGEFACRNCSRLTYASRQRHGTYFGDVISPLIDHLSATSNRPREHLTDQERNRLKKIVSREKSFKKQKEGRS